jgi:uncharacterized protein
LSSTNIVASASFWRGKPFDCLSAWARGECEAVVSPQTLSEYFETIEELAARYPTMQRVEWAESLTAAAELVFTLDRARGEVKDPDDEIFLECALAGRADCIVSGDKAHLLPLREWRGIKILSAAQFLAG